MAIVLSVAVIDSVPTPPTDIPVKLLPSPWNLVAETAPSVIEMALPALTVVAVTTPTTSISPLLKVVTPTVTMPVMLAPLARTWIPCCAVIIPTESTCSTS